MEKLGHLAQKLVCPPCWHKVLGQKGVGKRCPCHCLGKTGEWTHTSTTVVLCLAHVVVQLLATHLQLVSMAPSTAGMWLLVSRSIAWQRQALVTMMTRGSGETSLCHLSSSAGGQRSLSSYMWEQWCFHLRARLAENSCSQLTSWQLGLLQADFPLSFFCSSVWIAQSTNLGQILCGQQEEMRGLC